MEVIFQGLLFQEPKSEEKPNKIKEYFKKFLSYLKEKKRIYDFKMKVKKDLKNCNTKGCEFISAYKHTKEIRDIKEIDFNRQFSRSYENIYELSKEKIINSK